ncbi:STRC-like protein, partial [Mya arenaria]
MSQMVLYLPEMYLFILFNILLQLSSGFSRWLNLNKGGDASAVTSTELVSLGHFACGATNAHISAMSSTVYSYASSYIGKLTSCDEIQMTAFTNHAITAFGALSTWDDSVISTVGNMIGGLSDSDLSTLTESQIATISPEAVSLIPASSFVGFTPDQLSGFSVAQAQSTTSAQHAGLSQAQLDALISAGATVESSG